MFSGQAAPHGIPVAHMSELAPEGNRENGRNAIAWRHLPWQPMRGRFARWHGPHPWARPGPSGV